MVVLLTAVIHEANIPDLVRHRRAAAAITPCQLSSSDALPTINDFALPKPHGKTMQVLTDFCKLSDERLKDGMHRTFSRKLPSKRCAAKSHFESRFLYFDHPDYLGFGETAFSHSFAPSKGWATSTSKWGKFRGEVQTLLKLSGRFHDSI